MDYASTVTTTGADGQPVPVAHACGHDLHMACLPAAVRLMADHRDRWNGTLLALFQPAEETGDGAQGMVADGLFKRIPVPDVALSQHLLPGIAGTVGTCPGRSCRPRTGSRSPSTGAAATAPCRRTPSTRWCWPR